MNEDLCRCTRIAVQQCTEGTRWCPCTCPCHTRKARPDTPQDPKLLVAVRGTIPDLLCRCAPVVHRRTGTRDVVRELRGDTHMRIASADLLMWIGLEDWDLDLTDPVGCWIAARWAERHAPMPVGWWPDEESALVELAEQQKPLTPAQVDMLARLVMRLAWGD